MQYAQVVPPGFWSVTMYDGVTHYTAPNPINRYKLGSDDELKKNPDGSFTIYVQHDHPGADKEANWLPAPAGPFYFMLRNYAPAPALTEALKNPATVQGRRRWCLWAELKTRVQATSDRAARFADIFPLSFLRENHHVIPRSRWSEPPPDAWRIRDLAGPARTSPRLRGAG